MQAIPNCFYHKKKIKINHHRISIIYANFLTQAFKKRKGKKKKTKQKAYEPNYLSVLSKNKIIKSMGGIFFFIYNVLVSLPIGR